MSYCSTDLLLFKASKVRLLVWQHIDELAELSAKLRCEEEKSEEISWSAKQWDSSDSVYATLKL